ncbi:MAG: HAMP domain-containing histidine kinase [Verrucomicrobia bacterium]|jgi:signal transduction histidine kinase|nr:HAMP domain-containing histidine kinase [Verrucomicrobiota bacterium]MBT7066140.1 HAMP domain-containing histidine kinase [Verrucomicrobiota bacterium]MBT7698923.1 HAMP domain-containing histidine kinase [Verrucomicrobiota bacterium]
MKPTLITILLLIVVVPLVLMAWLGISLALNEKERVQRQFRQVLLARLSETSHRIDAVIDTHERTLLTLTRITTHNSAEIRAITRQQRLVKQFFIQSAKGDLSYPTQTEFATSGERSFLNRSRSIWESGTRFGRTAAAESDITEGPTDGWHTWFWGRGVHMLFWQRQPSGEVLGVEVDKMALMSDILAALPSDDGHTDSATPGLTRLVNAKKETIYQWGAHAHAEHASPAAELPLNEPLGSWTMQYYAPPLIATATSLFSMIAGLIVVALGLAGLAFYFYREQTRNIRVAEQKVSFVNQVSHELKTPLTNIRLYGELLHDSLAEEDERTRTWTGIIITESQRLSRLITNVLSFAGAQRGAAALRMSSGIVDEVIANVVASFRPLLEKRGMAIHIDANAPALVDLDPDALEQIIGNLLNNVEKYASTGQQLTLTSRQADDTTTIVVADNGPGIPPAEADHIFEPFTRLSNKVTDGVTGAGMGLGISRNLARLHGGDLVINPSESGAAFSLTLHTPERAS